MKNQSMSLIKHHHLTIFTIIQQSLKFVYTFLKKYGKIKKKFEKERPTIKSQAFFEKNKKIFQEKNKHHK